MARIAALFLILMASVSLAAGCGSGESQEDIATEVARTWVDKSIDEVSDAVVELVIGKVPVVSQIAGDAIAEQVRDNVVWSYSAPRNPDGNPLLGRRIWAVRPTRAK